MRGARHAPAGGRADAGLEQGDRRARDEPPRLLAGDAAGRARQRDAAGRLRPERRDPLPGALPAPRRPRELHGLVHRRRRRAADREPAADRGDARRRLRRLLQRLVRAAPGTDRPGSRLRDLPRPRADPVHRLALPDTHRPGRALHRRAVRGGRGLYALCGRQPRVFGAVGSFSGANDNLEQYPFYPTLSEGLWLATDAPGDGPDGHCTWGDPSPRRWSGRTTTPPTWPRT